MKFTLTIESSDAAMTNDPIETTVAALKTAITKLNNQTLDGNLRDANGNTIGSFELTADTESDQDEAENVCQNVERLYDTARYGTAEDLEDEVRTWSSLQPFETFDPDNIDYDRLREFLRS